MRACCLLFVALAFASSSIASSPKAEKAFRQGQRQEAAGQWKEAEASYSAAIQDDPSDVVFYLHRAKARTELGDPQHALDDLNQAVRLSPHDPNVFELRGEAYAALQDARNALADY